MAQAQAGDPLESTGFLNGPASAVPQSDHDVELGGAPVGRAQGDELASKHPTATFFHIFFKVAAVTLYLFGTWLLTSSFVLIFVGCVLCLAFDFWTVKNVTGRLLVGLRWWNEVKDDGTESWVFESKPDNRHVHPTDSLVFWGALYLTPVAWVVLAIVALFGLQFRWLLIVIVALTLSGANMIGYWKCQKDARQKLTSFTTQFIANRL